MIIFEENEFKGLIELLEKNEGCKIDFYINKIINSVSLSGIGYDTDLYIKNKMDESLMISRIILSRKREGTGEKVLNWLTDYANKKGFKSIEFQSVLTEPMANFCNKHGFTRVIYTDIEISPWYGDYVKKIV